MITFSGFNCILMKAWEKKYKKFCTSWESDKFAEICQRMRNHEENIRCRRKCAKSYTRAQVNIKKNEKARQSIRKSEK